MNEDLKKLSDDFYYAVKDSPIEDVAHVTFSYLAYNWIKQKGTKKDFKNHCLKFADFYFETFLSVEIQEFINNE